MNKSKSKFYKPIAEFVKNLGSRKDRVLNKKESFVLDKREVPDSVPFDEIIFLEVVPRRYGVKISEDGTQRQFDFGIGRMTYVYGKLNPFLSQNYLVIASELNRDCVAYALADRQTGRKFTLFIGYDAKSLEKRLAKYQASSSSSSSKGA